MKYFIKTYGCQMNVSDSERIAGALEKAGWKASSKDEADLLIINMCSVRQSAVDRIYGFLKSARSYQGVSKGSARGSYDKRKSKIILTGCILPEDRKKLKDKVDLIFEIKDLPKFLKMMAKTSPKHSSSSLAYVPISFGCNNFCSYCVVPYTRGREIYRPAEEIIAEIEKLVKRGYKEIVLLGQNVNSYCSNLKCQISNVKSTSQNLRLIKFPQLLQILNTIPDDFQLSFLTSHPKDMSDELIEVMAKCDKIKKELHLPVQSGDNEILKKMNRKYTVQDYEKLIGKIRDKISNISISTDIIVGFPNETKKQFENTVKLCKKIKFDKAYIAQYSPRPGTAAYQLKDNVPQQEKKRRWKILNEMINK